MTNDQKPCEFCGGQCPTIMESKYPWHRKDYDSVCADYIADELKDFKTE